MAETKNGVPEQFTCRKCIRRLPIAEMSSHNKNLCRVCRAEEQREYRRRKAEERHIRDDQEDAAIAEAAEWARTREAEENKECAKNGAPEGEEMGHDMTEYEADRQQQERNTVRSEDLAVYRTPFQNSHIVPIWDQALTWEVALFDGYEALREKLLQDAAECFRDPRMQVLWILHQHYLCAVPSETE